MKTLIDVIGYDYERSLNQSNTFTKEHVRYNIIITRNDTMQKMSFEYQCNPKYNRINKDDLLYSIISDAMAYEYSDDDIDTFANEYGYESVKECLKAFNACKKIYNNLVEFCGSYQLYSWLKDHYQEY